MKEALARGERYAPKRGIKGGRAKKNGPEKKRGFFFRAANYSQRFFF